MQERVTDRTRKIMSLANQQAQKWNHESIGTEHILLGILGEKSGIEIEVLKKYSVDIEKLKENLEQSMKSGPDMVTMGKLPQTPEAKQVIAEAFNYAKDHDFNIVDSYHILAGLIRVTKGKASQALTEFNFTEENLTLGLENLLGNEWPGNETTQTEDKKQGYWNIPKSELDVRRLLGKIYDFDFSCAELAITEKKPETVTIFSEMNGDAVGSLKKTSEEPSYDEVTLTPKEGDLEQLKKVAYLKQILDRYKIPYNSEPPIEDVVKELRADATESSRAYDDVADSLEGKVK
jgi:ATP-dependent Clp protease ATP-binding subunit ClpA